MKIKRLWLLLSFLVGCISCYKQNSQKQSISDINSVYRLFLQEYQRFDKMNLPVEFQHFSVGIGQRFDSIPNIIIKNDTLIRYLFIDYVNDRHSYRSPKLDFGIIGKLEISEKYFTIIYIKGDLGINNTQYILANYTKNEANLISKIILFGTDFMNYRITSKINKDLTIEVNSIYLYSCCPSECIPTKGLEDYYCAKAYSEKYKITDNGEIILISEKDEQRGIAKIEGPNFIFPVELPK